MYMHAKTEKKNTKNTMCFCLCAYLQQKKLFLTKKNKADFFFY
jgi:hypothetical protein